MHYDNLVSMLDPALNRSGMELLYSTYTVYGPYVYLISLHIAHVPINANSTSFLVSLETFLRFFFMLMLAPGFAVLL